MEFEASVEGMNSGTTIPAWLSRHGQLERQFGESATLRKCAAAIFLMCCLTCISVEMVPN